jgi:hypothetical protein
MIASAVDIVIYIVIFYVVFSILELSSLSLLGLLFSGRFHINWADKNSGSYLIMVPGCLAATYFILSGGFGYPPPFIETRGEILNKSAVEAKLNSLEEESQKLYQALAGLDNLTLKEIQKVIEGSLTHLQGLMHEMLRQEELLKTLRTMRSDELAQNQEQIKQTELITAISDEQLEAVKLLLTREVTDIYSSTFWTGAAFSFLIGFLSSFAASKISKFDKCFGRENKVGSGRGNDL